MLKKVMIICLALSFVFIGGIGIALADDGYNGPYGPFGDPSENGSGEPEGPLGPGDCYPEFIDPDSSIIIAKRGNCQRECCHRERRRSNCAGCPYRLQDGSCQDFTSHDSFIIIAAQERAQNGHGPGPAPNSGDGIPDGPGWPDFISNNSSMIIAHGYDEDKGKGDQDKLRDGSCQE